MQDRREEEGSAGHPFDAAIALHHQGAGVFTGETSPAYANMVGPYGGITAAQALNALLAHPDRLGEPIALTVNYAAAVADGPFTVITRAARTNRSTQHWTFEFQQDGQAVITGTAVFGLRRDTWGLDKHPMPSVTSPAELRAQSWERAKVEWLRRYEMRFVEGGMPRSWQGEDQGHSLTRLWVRDAPPRPLDFASLAAISDIFFPRIWLRRSRIVPLGTVSITVYFHTEAATLAATGEGYLLGEVRGHALSRGYFDHAGQLWNEAGHLLATTHQIVYYKE